MCGKREFFFEFDNSFKDNVKMGNNSCLSVHGRGRIRIEMNGIIHVITDVFFVPELKNNLLSLGQLMEKGLAVMIKQGKCKIFHPERGLIMETQMTHNRLFVIIVRAGNSSVATGIRPIHQQCFSSAITDQATLWHIATVISAGMGSTHFNIRRW
jgi:hypothetical protein